MLMKSASFTLECLITRANVALHPSSKSTLFTSVIFLSTVCVRVTL